MTDFLHFCHAKYMKSVIQHCPSGKYISSYGKKGVAIGIT